jgi:general secretion pathway protein G
MTRLANKVSRRGRWKRALENEDGFTLIEVLFVVIILAVIASMVVPRLAGRAERARISIAKTDITANIPTALDLYELDNGRYPTTEQGLAALVREPGASPPAPRWAGPYLKALPLDPWKRGYEYRCPSTTGSDYDLLSAGPDGVAGNDDDINSWELATENPE